MIQLGIDFGGTKIEIAALNPEGEFLSRQRVANPGNYYAAIRTICDLVTKVEGELGARGSVGIGTPGSISPITGLMSNANSVYLNGRPFRNDLIAALGREIRIANDANCMALSESFDGAAAGARVVFGIIVGTGCGGGLVVEGHLLEGANGIAGEWGHNPLPWPQEDEFPGAPCWCGRYGCVETYVSGTGLQRDFHARTGQSLSGAEIADCARGGDSAATAVFKRLIDRFGRSVAAVCNLVDPDVIVLAGGLSNVAEIYAWLPDAVRKYVFSDQWETRIVPAKWGDSSGVRGAARLWPLDDRGRPGAEHGFG